MRNPYEVLGVRADDSLATIKKAYRMLALKYHPDHNPGDASAADKFIEVDQAWKLISQGFVPVEKPKSPMWVHKSLFNISKETN